MDVPEPTGFNNLTAGMSLLAGPSPWKHKSNFQIGLQEEYYSVCRTWLGLNLCSQAFQTFFSAQTDASTRNYGITPVWIAVHLTVRNDTYLFFSVKDFSKIAKRFPQFTFFTESLWETQWLWLQSTAISRSIALKRVGVGTSAAQRTALIWSRGGDTTLPP